jgi:hypothetical protein
MRDTTIKKVCEKVNVRYHKRIEEIMKVLDPQVDYTIKYIRNPSVFREAVKSLSGDRNGYTRVSGSFNTLHGKFKVMPEFKIIGSFVVCLAKDRLMNPSKGDSFFENTLLIFEQPESNILDLVRGVS